MKKIFLALMITLLISPLAFAEDYIRDSTAGALSVSYTKTSGGKRIEEIRIHLSAAATTSENLVIYIDSGVGAAYDIVLLTQDMSGIQDLIYVPDTPQLLVHSEDKLMITYTNTDGRTVGYEIIMRS